jgi:hypothetical protein
MSMPGKTAERISIAVGLWFWSFIIAVFFDQGSPFFSSYALWSCRIFVALAAALLLGFVIYCIAFGARETFKLYREAVTALKPGLFGRVALAIYFVIAFVIALCFVRW